MNDERRVRGELSVDRIRQAAVAIVQADGLEALSMRRIAAELEVWPTAVYHHVGDKTGLVQLVLDDALDRLELPHPETGWRQWLRSLALSIRQALLAYPGLASHLATSGNPSRPAYQVIDAALGKLLDSGFSPKQSALLWINLYSYILARVQREEHLDSSERAGANLFDQLRVELQLQAADLASLQQVAEEWFRLGMEEYFTAGVELFLAGADRWLGPSET